MNTDNGQILILNARKRLEISEVLSVISFSDDYLELPTEAGDAYIEGSELKIEELSQEKKKILISGKIDAIFYKDKEKHTKKKKAK